MPVIRGGGDPSRDQMLLSDCANSEEALENARSSNSNTPCFRSGIGEVFDNIIEDVWKENLANERAKINARRPQATHDCTSKLSAIRRIAMETDCMRFDS